MEDHDSSDIQTLRLLKAFFAIEDSQARDLIVAIAEAAAGDASLNANAFRLLLHEKWTN